MTGFVLIEPSLLGTIQFEKSMNFQSGNPWNPWISTALQALPVLTLGQHRSPEVLRRAYVLLGAPEAQGRTSTRETFSEFFFFHGWLASGKQPPNFIEYEKSPF